MKVFTSSTMYGNTIVNNYKCRGQEPGSPELPLGAMHEKIPVV
jgi:hypothetical protein